MSVDDDDDDTWSNPPFLISDIRALCRRSVLSARAPKCQKLKMVG